MHVHILGICGTFMGGIAQLARELGYTVSGSDSNVYPPMSTQLQQAGITVSEGYHGAHLHPAPDLVVIGNALSRGNPAIEYVLDNSLPYMSGPEFLARYILQGRWTLGVAGTHGKTTTASMLAWILDHAGLAPGFLIGGVTHNFPVSARLGQTPFFVVEADEYDTAFFDKRSKFVHYRPRTVILNNLEYDHADIFPNVEAIITQFHHLVRTIPGTGLIVRNDRDAHLATVIHRGCWTPQQTFDSEQPSNADWQAREVSASGDRFTVWCEDREVGTVRWQMIGQHNVANALAAIAAARHAGVPAAQGVAALNQFAGVKRRMELYGTVNRIRVYDDFAHHPTAIETTLQGLRQQVGNGRIIAVLEPRSNTMKLGVHRDSLADSLRAADDVMMLQPAEIDWPLDEVASHLPSATVHTTIDAIIDQVVKIARAGDHVLVMSNGAFGGIHAKLLKRLEQLYA
ncbi:MAG: UDP-N-acetylmuramate:L-alanyl-gamma-D-glutamyl-meso-diaminopimelate ligase [Gammaproteobacteria bacterium]|nr:UDP-N-acetylmuramate:L-alanyl-gamma-D-glutamyl-meso-diaminopimelate ligase [Gammaproteobacteria bacterium]